MSTTATVVELQQSNQMSVRPYLQALKPAGFRAARASATDSSRVVPVDATWHMPNVPKDAKSDFLNKERIKDAVYFDLDKVCLQDSKYPHMLPSLDTFNKEIGKLGIKNTDKLVMYDTAGIFSSPRAAWQFALYGHPQVYFLDNYSEYKGAQYPIRTEKVDTLTPFEPTKYEGISQDKFEENYRQQVIDYEELLELVQSGELTKKYIFLDARPKPRFTGEAPEPRPGLSSGHVPGSLSLPFKSVLNENNTYKSKQELLDLFKSEYGLDLSNKDFLNGRQGFIVSCGSGVTAVILKLALESIVGLDVPVRVYDGSWSEWADRAPEEFIEKDV